MELIEPNHFDAVVFTSGLPEVLIASALARAGKSVLVLDAADSYGASWSSLSGQDHVHCLVNRHLEQQQLQGQQDQSETGAAGASQIDQGQAAQPADAQRTANADSTLSHVQQSPTTVELKTVQPYGSLHGSVALYTHPEVDAALANKQLIIDLAPKVLYQDELLVHLLVSCQAHNYLEFKLVEGSYIYQGGRLRPVPASRADLFADKSLSLTDKRSLGRFLTACMEAQQGFGRLKDCFDSRPLVELLTSEGLSDTLQQVVMYGIAMADMPQQQQQQAAADASGSCTDSSSSSTSSSSHSSHSGRLLTAAAGLAALQLYTTSLGRYGGTGALMAPSYGCGSIPEAFVRLAAVKGAVTALRHGAQQLLLLPPTTQEQQQQQQHIEMAAPAAAGAGGAGEDTLGAASAASQQAAAARVQIVLTSGQTITANTVVGCHDAMRAAADAAIAQSSAAKDSLSSSTVAHAVVLLNGSLVDGDNSLLLVMPPGSLGPRQTAVIRGLQFGPALAVTPPGKYLLYLSAVLPPGYSSNDHSNSSGKSKAEPAGACTAEQLLEPAVDALVSSRGLEALRYGAGDEVAAEIASQQEEQQGAQAAAASVADGVADTVEQRQQLQEQQLASLKPQALALCYYTTQQVPQQFSQLQQQQLAQGETYGLWCPAAPAGFTGYDAVVRATEAAYRQQFPDLPWLIDEVKIQRLKHVGSTEASVTTAGRQAESKALGTQTVGDAVPEHEGSGGSGANVEDDDEAIYELTAALAELSSLANLEQ